MLNKDLLRYKIRNRKIHPLYIDADSEELQLFAKQLLKIYNLPNISRNKLAEALKTIIDTFHDLKLAKGLNKILQDNSEFIPVSNDSLPESRAKLFTIVSNIIKDGKHITNYQAFYEQVLSNTPFSKNFNNLYSDLPENDILQNFKLDNNPVKLLHRYNCVLIQSLLLYSQQLKLKIIDPEIKEMRGIFRYLKFFRLMAHVKQENNNCFIIDIDGPLSILESSTKYGLQLAAFFPFACFLKQWNLSAEIKLKGSSYKLSVSNLDNIKSHYSRFTSYIPEEFEMFEKMFNEKNYDWKIIKSQEIINLGKQNMFFPDFTFENKLTQKKVHLELFHRWHYNQLTSRLNSLDKICLDSYFIGIDRSIYKKKEIKLLIERTPEINHSYFLFNDFPGVSNTLNILKQKKGAA